MRKLLTELSNEELWRLFPIIISEHKEEWKNNYLEEEVRLKEYIGESNIVRINHIGSTAIGGLLAKPTIDILVEVTENISTDDLVKNMEQAGYIYSPQPNNPPPHMMYMKGYTPEGFQGQAYHIHVRYAGDWDELYFRDYLLAHSEVAKEYGELKLRLKDKYMHNRDTYTQAKTEFIKSVTALARKEFPDRYKIESGIR